jgi:hypothetical protein
MDRLNRAAIITQFVARLRENGSWGGETHIQKGVYLLQDLLDVPLEFMFILYKHGPFSFDLRDELTSLRAAELLLLEAQAPPYGPRFAATELSNRLRRMCADTLAQHDKDLEFVADVLGARSVGELERLATALYVTKQRTSRHDGSVRLRAECLNRLKPHVPIQAARSAVEEIDQLIAEAESGRT